jgi:hypothetical protein
MSQDVFDRTDDGCMRDGEDATPWSEHRHAEELALGVNQGTALGGAAKGYVGGRSLARQSRRRSRQWCSRTECPALAPPLTVRHVAAGSGWSSARRLALL